MTTTYDVLRELGVYVTQLDVSDSTRTRMRPEELDELLQNYYALVEMGEIRGKIVEHLSKRAILEICRVRSIRIEPTMKLDDMKYLLHTNLNSTRIVTDKPPVAILMSRSALCSMTRDQIVQAYRRVGLNAQPYLQLEYQSRETLIAVYCKFADLVNGKGLRDSDVLEYMSVKLLQSICRQYSLPVPRHKKTLKTYIARHFHLSTC